MAYYSVLVEPHMPLRFSNNSAQNKQPSRGETERTGIELYTWRYR
jgi:hypothetical protein